MNFFRFILSRRRIFTILVVLLPIVAGTYSYRVLPKAGNPEIAMPGLSATLTIMAAFLPMLLMTGTTGEYMGFMPKTVSIALRTSF